MTSPALLKKAPVTDSEFYMWRTLFAMAHADGQVSDEEVRFMAEALEDMPFSPEQAEILRNDIKIPQDVIAMFKGVTDKIDQARFFSFARDLVWADGVYGQEEQTILLKLQETHIRSINVDDLIGKIEMEFAGESAHGQSKKRQRKPREVLFSFREQFFRAREGS